MRKRIRKKSLTLTCRTNVNTSNLSSRSGASPLRILINLPARCAFTCSLWRSARFISIHLHPSFLSLSSSPSLLHLLYISLLPPCLLSLDTTINHREWEGLFVLGVIICTLCKLSGHDELVALNRPLLTDTGDTNCSLLLFSCDLSKPKSWQKLWQNTYTLNKRAIHFTSLFFS